MSRRLIVIIKYENKKFNVRLTVNLVITSFNKKIKKPIEIAINKILNKFSFLWNLLVNPKITKASTTIKKGFKTSDK